MAARSSEAEAREGLLTAAGGFIENGAVNFGSDELGISIGRGRGGGA